MNQVKAKVYYLIETGEVLVVTSEMQGSVIETTKEQDMEFYPQLQNRTLDEIDYIELEYGTLASTFNNVSSYCVNLNTKELDIVYKTQEDIDEENLSIKYEQELQTRISTITSYINQDTSSIDDIENAIIQYELTNIQNGDV